MNFIEELTKSSKLLEETGENYLKASSIYAKAEERFKIIKSEIYGLNEVQGLGNQSLRDAEADRIMQFDDRFKDIYFEYTESKMLSKEAWVKYEVRKEINDNLRVLVNNLTFMKGGINE